MPQLARPIALAILRERDRILVFSVPDDGKGITGFRPPGGTIEFGETGAVTVVREIKEELAVDVVDPRYLGTLENIYTYLGEPGHELARIADFGHDELYPTGLFELISGSRS